MSRGRGFRECGAVSRATALGRSSERSWERRRSAHRRKRRMRRGGWLTEYYQTQHCAQAHDNISLSEALFLSFFFLETMFRKKMREKNMNAQKIIEITQWELDSLFRCCIRNYIHITNILFKIKVYLKWSFCTGRKIDLHFFEIVGMIDIRR